MSKHYGRTFRKRSKLKKEIDDQKETFDDYHELMKWMSKKGYKSSKKLRPKNFSCTGRGLMALEKVCNGDIIVSIPQSLLITPQLILKSNLGKLLKRFCPKASGAQILSVFLMYEMISGKASDWHLYLKTLPLNYTTPAYFSQKTLSYLPDSLYCDALKQINAIQESYMELNFLFHYFEEFDHSFKDKFNFDTYRWAWYSVNTRCVYIECIETDCNKEQCTFHVALVPFLDLLNHSCNVQVKAGYNEHSRSYEITSLCNFKKYSQVFINYGNHDNRKLFLEYGFVIPQNLHDTIPIIEGDLMNILNQCSGLKSDWLENIKFIQQKGLLRNAVCTCKELSWNLDSALKILSVGYNPKLWEFILHQDYSLNSKEIVRFQKIKQKLLLLKLEEYSSLNDVNVEEYDCYHLKLILDLFSVEKNILNMLLTSCN